MTVKEIAEATAKSTFEMNKKQSEQEAKAHEEAVKARNIKYPFQIASVKRQKKVLGVDAKLFTPTDKEGLSPLELHSGFSRFELTIVDKDTNTTPTANIPAKDMYYIAKMTDIASQHIVSCGLNGNTGTTNTVSPAYTQKLVDKNFKGMTPAEVLLKDPSQETALKNTRNWLEQNVAKYPANKAQITAIDEAIKLLNDGKLSAADATTNVSSQNLVVYKTDYKFKSKKNEKGYNLIYGIEVTCDPTRNYPFTITIMNCYAPVETGANGQKNIKMNAAENTVRSSLPMDKMEWICLVENMSRILSLFEQMNFANLFKDAQIAGQY